MKKNNKPNNFLKSLKFLGILGGLIYISLTSSSMAKNFMDYVYKYNAIQILDEVRINSRNNFCYVLHVNGPSRDCSEKDWEELNSDINAVNHRVNQIEARYQ